MMTALVFIGGAIIGGLIGAVGMAALCVAGMSDDDLRRLDEEEARRAEVTHGFEARLPQVRQTYPESGAHDLTCHCVSCLGLDEAPMR